MTAASYRVVISGEIDVEPRKREPALIEAQPLIAAALAEPGCVHYTWTADPATPGRIHVFEEWDTEGDLIAHLAAAPYRDMAGHLAATGILSAVTRKYRVDLVEPVYDSAGNPRGDFFTAN
jgi:quinol monooxygenase YgiN